MLVDPVCKEAGELWLFCELGVGVLALLGLLLLVSVVWICEQLWDSVTQRRSGADHDDDADQDL